MKKIRKVFAAVVAATMTVSVSACAVPYPYFDAVGKYVGENREAFSEQLDQIHEAVIDAVESGTQDASTQDYILRLLGINRETLSGAVEESSSTPAIPNIPETVPSAKSEKDTAETSEKSEGAGTVPETEDESTADSSEEQDSAEETPVPELTEEASADKKAESAELSPYVPEYVHYEKEDFEKLCEDFTAAGEDNDIREMERLYVEAKDMLCEIATMDAVSFILFCTDVSNSTYDEENAYCEKLLIDCDDQFMIACHDVCNSKGKDSFKQFCDPALYEDALEYEPLTDHAKELFEQETELENKYNKEQGTIEKISYTYGGRTYTVEDLMSDSSPLSLLSLFDYEGFLEVYRNLLKGINDRLGPIYVDLLQVRKELAKEFEVESYADYCYSEMFGRSYTTKDAEEFCDNMKKNFTPRYYNEAYESIYNTSYFTTEFTVEEMLKNLSFFARKTDKLAEKAFKELQVKKLYNIGEGENRYQGSYTTSLYSEHIPYIFVNAGNGLDGLTTLTHEFGHFINDLYEQERDPDYILRTGNFDVLEIHSNAFQLMCTNMFKDIVDANEAEKGQKYVVSSELDSICEGCIFDEFQRKAYENPDMTLEELNELYKNICLSYGQTMPAGMEYSWVMINHSFESPMYYISYAISALSALEIWLISCDDMDKGIDCWVQVLMENDEQDYEKIMKDTGLTSFMDSKGALEICDQALELFSR